MPTRTVFVNGVRMRYHINEDHGSRIHVLLNHKHDPISPEKFVRNTFKKKLLFFNVMAKNLLTFMQPMFANAV